MSIKSELEAVTPEIARKWLEKNNMNRPVNQLNVESLAAEISKKNFHFTGESIKFAKDGTLLDGQHRLLAVLTANKPAKFLVVRGLDKESFKYMDTGRTRKASDVLAIEGIENPAKIAAMVNFIIGFKRGAYDHNTRRKRGANKITNAMVSQYVSVNLKQLKDSYGFGFGKGKRLIAGNIIASMHYLFKELSEKEADDFIQRLVEGTNLTKTSPIHLLRERFINDARAKRHIGQKEKVALIIKTWNLYREDKKVEVLRWDSRREEFPKIK